MGIQVTELTNGKACHEKEFIDFEFAGRHISEFGMVAVADGGRHSFDAAPTFENETSSVHGVDGQYFWGTHFGSKKMSFSLATDGMTESQVNDFKYHFQPGRYGAFIEDKLSCRKAYARISQVITFNMVPFRTQKKITIGNTVHNIFINEYKGDCRIIFEFDNPYFETTLNIIDLENEKDLQKNLRAMYINNTPTTTSWKDSSICFFGIRDKFFNGRNGVTVTPTGGISWPNSGENRINYYNPGTAKTKACLEIQYTPSFTSTFPIYFNNIKDGVNCGIDKPYNRIYKTYPNDTRENNEKTEFRYTSPSIIYQTNRAIQMAKNFYDSGDGVALNFEEQLRMEIVNPKVMSWAAFALRSIKNKPDYYTEAGNFTTNTLFINCSKFQQSEAEECAWWQYFNLFMLYIMAEYFGTEPSIDLEYDAVNWKFNPYTIIFKGQENHCCMNYSYNSMITNLEKVTVKEENCGDMILSEYLVLDGGNTLNQEGEISSYYQLEFIKGDSTSDHPEWISLSYVPTYF